MTTSVWASKLLGMFPWFQIIIQSNNQNW